MTPTEYLAMRGMFECYTNVTLQLIEVTINLVIQTLFFYVTQT